MVKAFNRPGIRVTKRFTNVMHTAILSGGRVVYKKWPKKRGKTKPGAVADMRKMFGWAASQSVLAIPQDKIFAETITKGSMYYPRDALISAMYGTLINIRNADGSTLWSRRMADRNIQAMLDTITNTPGAIIVRGAEEWIGLNPGTSGDVFTAFGPGAIPQWQPPSAGKAQKSVALQTFAPTGYTSTSEGGCALGNLYKVTTDFTIDAIVALMELSTVSNHIAPWFATATLSGSTYKVSTYAQGANVTSFPATSPQYNFFEFTTPIDLHAGDFVAFGIIRTDATGTTAPLVAFNSGQLIPILAPLLPIGRAELQTLTPTAGTTIFRTSDAAAYYVGVEILQ